MTPFNREQYDSAIAEWERCCTDFSRLKNLIPTNYIFELSLDQITWLKERNNCKEFCAEVGVFNNQLVLILSPLEEDGKRKSEDEHPYSVLCELGYDLRLVETQEYMVINNAVLSRDLRNLDHDSDVFYPVANKPLMEQDKAIKAIESWRNEGEDWFYFECTEHAGRRIFQRFYVPSTNLTPPKPGLSRFVCSFGLKYSDVYQRMLVTLIFISFYDDLTNEGSIETISNTYDWSRPCPPICQL